MTFAGTGAHRELNITTLFAALLFLVRDGGHGFFERNLTPMR
jgi:hypothetical protein